MAKREKPIQGSFYQHFKGKLYQIKDVAIHTETGEEMVVYQAMYPPFGIWVRPLEMFLEEVDQNKYPQVKQKYRFEKVEILQVSEAVAEKETISESGWKEIFINQQIEKKLIHRYSKEEIIQKGLMVFLDADTFKEKREILIGLKDYIDKRFLGNVAISMDLLLEEGSVQEQYDAILYYIDKRTQYEGGRLR